LYATRFQSLEIDTLCITYRMAWENLGHKLRAGSVSLKEFRAFFSQGPASLHDIQVTSINVVDHLGENIPVPTIFCSSWKARLCLTLYFGFGS
jgi:hypothetical protein